jgi:DNA-binding GntR family transcriptional regulator
VSSNPAWSVQPVAGSFTLRDRAYDAIKAGILCLELAPGTSLVETALADRLGISKSPVRDALHRLEREGLVIRAPFKGVQVAPLERTDVLDAFGVRASLEELAVRRASESATTEQIETARRLIAEGEQAVEAHDEAAVEVSVDGFHRAVAAASGSPLLVQLLGNVYDRLARVRALVVRTGTRGEASMGEHSAILEAIAARDAEAAVAASRAHAERLLGEVEGLLTPRSVLDGGPS